MKTILKKSFSILTVATILLLSLGVTKSGQTLYTGYIYVLSADDYYASKYSRAYSGAGDEFVTKYTIYHPTKGYAWMTVTATHFKNLKKVEVSVDDTNEGMFPHINDEETSYETASLEEFGFRGVPGTLGGKRIPNQLMVKFVSNKFENVKVVHILGSAKSGSDHSWFILDEKN